MTATRIGSATLLAIMAAGLPGAAAAQGLLFAKTEDLAQMQPVARYRAWLPPRVDLSRWFPTPGSQGRTKACVGWAVAYARAYYMVRFGGGVRNRRADIPSAAFIYGAVTRPANCTRGSRIPDALKLLIRQGAMSAARLPHNSMRCPAPYVRRLRPRPEFRRFSIATAYIIGRRHERYRPRLDDVKGRLARGHPVIVGARIGRAFTRLRGNQVWRGGGRLVPGGHAMTVVGYDERRQAFKLINSWGTRWANRGFGWMGYRAFRRHVRYAFYMRVGRRRPPIAVRPKPRPRPVRPKVVRPKVVRPNVRPKPVRPKPVRPKIVRPKPPAPPPVTFDPPLSRYKCAGLRLVRGRAGPQVRGFVASAKDLAALRASAARANASVAVQVRPWPQCEVLLTFRRVLRAPGAPKLELAGGKRSFAKGDPLVIKVTTPRAPRYLYLVFIQASGGVVYLVQPSSAVAAPQPPGRTLVFGDGANGGAKFTVSAPYGDEMVLAIASESPLFDKARPQTEIERDFLTAFRRAFLYRPEGQARRRKVAASWIALTTREK